MSVRKIISFLSLFLFFACSINDPELPEWDTNWKVYFPTKDLIMGEEIINDSTFISRYSNDSIPLIMFNLEDSTDWERVESSDLIVEPREDHYSSTLGEVNLGDYNDVQSDSTGLLEILPGALFLGGDSLLPFDTLTVHIPNDTLQFSEYIYAIIDKGELWITFCNMTFLTVREGLRARIYTQNGTSQFIGETVFNELIPPNSSAVGNPITLDDKLIYNEFRIEYSIPIAASPSGRRLTEDELNGYMCTILSVNNLTATEALAKIPQQTVNDTSAVGLQDTENQIIDGEIGQGTIQFLITNTLPIDIHVDLTLPNIKKNGSQKVITSQLTAKTDKVITEDLSGWEIFNYRNPGSIIDSLDYFAQVTSDSTEDYTLVYASDSISINVVTDTIHMASVTGVLDTVDFNIEPVELDKIDVFQDIDGKVRLNDLNMQLVFRNEIDIPINIDLRVTGRRTDTQDSVFINVDTTIAASSQSPTTIINMDENSSNPSIVDLLEILPDEITIRGTALLYGEGRVSVGDGLRVEYNVSSPLNLEINEPLTFDSDIDSITYDDLDEDQRDNIVNDLANVKAKFNFINHVPIGAEFKYYMAVDSTELYSDVISDPTKKIVFETEIEPGIVGPNGYVQTAVPSAWEQEITDQQREIFNNPTIYVRQELTIPSTNGEIKIRQDDSIEIEAILDFQATINSERD